MMMQVAGEGEASSSGKMIALTTGLVAGTAWENIFNLDYCWCRTQHFLVDIKMIKGKPGVMGE